jgi:hypothetical protein
MEKNDGRAAPANFIDDLGVVATQGGQGVRSQVLGPRPLIRDLSSGLSS